MNREKAELSDLSKTLKKIYRDKMEKLRGRKYTPHKRFDDSGCWEKVAKVVQQLEADPEDYINAQFKYGKSTVFANMLSGEKAQNKWKKLIMFREEVYGGKPENIAENTDQLSIAEVEILDRIGSVLLTLVNKTGSNEFYNPEVRKALINLPLQFDALGVLVHGGNDRELVDVYGERAARAMEEEPFLRRAIESLGYDISFV